MVIGVIGGSGLYGVAGTELQVETPYGPTSGPLQKVEGKNTLYFLPRHGKNHSILPSEVNYRANLCALRKVGVQTVVSISAVGSLKEDISPGEFVLPDQYIDFTHSRVRSYFGEGVVAHAPFSDPTCETARSHIESLLKVAKILHHTGGTYVCIEGPQFSSRAESRMYRNLEKTVSIIGMTALPEAYLARELGLCYQTVAMATDFDSWNEEKESLSVEKIISVLKENVEKSKQLVASLGTQSFPACRSGCRELMKNAVATSKTHWPSSREEVVSMILS